MFKVGDKIKYVGPPAGLLNPKNHPSYFHSYTIQKIYRYPDSLNPGFMVIATCLDPDDVICTGYLTLYNKDWEAVSPKEVERW